MSNPNGQAIGGNGRQHRLPIEIVLDALRSYNCDPEERGGQWHARCPAHDDHKPSLSLRTGADGRVLVQCRSAGCSFESIVRALGLDSQDFFPSPVGGNGSAPPPRPRIVKFDGDDEFRDFLASYVFVFPTGEDCNRVAQASGFKAVPYNATRGSTRARGRKFIVVIPDGSELDADDASKRLVTDGAEEVIRFPVDADWSPENFAGTVAFLQPWIPRDGVSYLLEVEVVPEVNEADDDPHRLARQFLDDTCRHPDGLTLRFHQDVFYLWEGAAYRPLKSQELNAEINRHAKVEADRANAEAIRAWRTRGRMDLRGRPCPMPQAIKVGNQLVSNIGGALAGMTLVQGNVEAPAWLVPPPPFPAEDAIATRNAIVSLPDLVEGRKASVRPTPRFFATSALPFDFDASAPEPSAWIDFLRSLWNSDPESIRTLQEWFGYCLTADTRQQKILGLIGPKRSGKGTIARVLRALVGVENTAGPTLSGLCSNFGLEPLVGKRLAVISDARLSGRSDQSVILERLLSISGEDAITVDRKHKSTWTGKLSARIVLLSNELPRLGDASGAIASRFIFLKLTESFFGREDKGLFDRLGGELPGILLWAIQGWKRLRERGAFAQPESASQLADDMERLASPYASFVRDRCELRPEIETPVKTMYQAWKEWCESAGRDRPGEIEGFGRGLTAACPGLGKKQRRTSEGIIRVYVGIGLASAF